MTRPLLAALLAATALSAPDPLRAEGDAEQGRKIVRLCSPCHGRDGLAVRANTPDIGGLDRDYIALQLADYRAGDRVHPEMNVVAKGLSDAQIADLAAWFAAQAERAD
jgi:cytochrome c553